jgi:hypothetical protein
VSDRFQQIERRAEAQNKRIAELESGYKALLEDLKVLRTQMAGVIYPPPAGPQPAHQNGQTPPYISRFDRWPSPNPDDERVRNASNLR